MGPCTAIHILEFGAETAFTAGDDDAGVGFVLCRFGDDDGAHLS